MSVPPPDRHDRARLVQQIFEAALDRPEPERAEFLGEACAGDPALHAEVDGLLGALARAETRDLLPSPFAEMPGPRVGLTLGQKVHNYTVGSLIAEGGMGAVYHATHDVLGRAAALKVLHPEFSRNADVVQRFINEARAAHAIGHPNIIDVIDAGRLDGAGGAPYILMELLHGESLGARLRRAGGLPIAEAVLVARETARALHAAHDKGIIHRDLKPENIYLATGGEALRVKVLDFGIAKLRGELGGGLATTQTGAFYGTPQYMSPEQCRSFRDIDQRSDIYALGAILYEMVTGVPPFSADNIGALIYKHLTVSPEPPGRMVPALPVRLEALILSALAKDPAARPASMAAFIDELDAIAAALPAAGTGAAAMAPTEVLTSTSLPSARPSSSPAGVAARPDAGGRRKLVGAVALGAVALGAVALASGLVWSRRNPGPGAARAPVIAPARAPAAPAPAAPSSPPPATVAAPDPITPPPKAAATRTRKSSTPVTRSDPRSRIYIEDAVKANPYR